MTKLLSLILTILTIAGVSSSAMAIDTARGMAAEQSSHNFSHKSWLPITKICSICHIPHRRRRSNKNKHYADGLRWNRKVSSFTYDLYNSIWSSSLISIYDTSWTSPVTGKEGGLPDGLSKLCLSCHDGVIAPDVFNLHHFVSLEYDVRRAELRDPDQTQMGVSGPISEVLHNGKIQCSSCHDAHDEESVAGTRLLRVNKDEICITCHKK